MFEYAIILALSRILPKKPIMVNVMEGENTDSYDIEQIGKWMDRGTMIFSATLFLIFNLCYWIAAHNAHHS